MPRGPVWTEKEKAILGSAIDPEVAERLGRSVTAVKKKRIQLGIAAAIPGSRHWKRRQLKRLGQLSDAALAEQLGVSRLTVYRRRHREGIAAAHAENAPQKPRKRAAKAP